MLWLWIVLGVLVVAVIAMLRVGARLPLAHRAEGVAVVRGVPPEAVFDTLADVASGPAWRRGLKAVELQAPTADGRSRYRELGRDGAILFEVVEERRPDRRVVRIADDTLPFGGTWTWELSVEGSGTRVVLTEQGEIRNVLFRFAAHYLVGYTKTIERFLADLVDHLELPGGGHASG